MEINDKKQNRQLEGLRKWKEARGIGTLNWETAVGKTHAAFLLIQKVFESNGIVKIAIVVPSETLVKKWNNDIENYIKDPIQKAHIFVYGANSVITNNIHSEVFLLIIDEIHEFFTEGKEAIVKGLYIEHRFRLGLTATPPEDKQRFRLMQGICPIVDVITSREAIESGFIAPYVVYNLAVDLTEDERIFYDNITSEIDTLFEYFGRNLSSVNSCVDFNTSAISCKQVARTNGWTENSEHNEINKKFNPYKIKEYAFTLLKLFRDRTNIVYNAENKLKVGLELVKKFKNIKAISFSESTTFADRLGLIVNNTFRKEDPTAILNDEYEYCTVYHSNLEPKMLVSPKSGKIIKFGLTRLKQRAEERLRNSESFLISTVSSLDSGFNVEDLKIAFIFSRTSKITQWRQRTGRVKRLQIGDETSKKLIVNVYAADTKDEDWLKNSQKMDFSNVKTVFSVDSIIF